MTGVRNAPPVAYISRVALGHAKLSRQYHGGPGFSQVGQHIIYIVPPVEPHRQAVRVPVFKSLPFPSRGFRPSPLCFGGLCRASPAVPTILLIRTDESATDTTFPIACVEQTQPTVLGVSPTSNGTIAPCKERDAQPAKSAVHAPRRCCQVRN